jgi:hypothetical protein
MTTAAGPHFGISDTVHSLLKGYAQDAPITERRKRCILG